ncbi:hypothetical protein AB0J74_28530 [Asanoa sp. NPDC049573]|uniref:hypothetical protein n=1 Tax=Asanoa sp. NPDC049573 TaxID=3155396 RepID=UPI00341578C3
MTTPSGGNLPAAAAGAFIAGGLTDDETEAPEQGETVGASDAEADRARAEGRQIPAGATRDSDGVPVGDADAAEDARRTGADPDRV